MNQEPKIKRWTAKRKAELVTFDKILNNAPSVFAIL